MIKKRMPGRLQLSTECNHDCIFCSVPKEPVKKLRLDEIKSRIKKLKALGTTDLFITGGEPTIHKNFIDTLEFAEKQEFNEITIQTNGTELNKSLLEKIKDYKNIKFYISFHSFDKETNEKLSNSKTYENIISGLRNLQDLNIPVNITVVINELNYHHLKEHFEFIKKNFPKVKHFSINFIDPVGRAKKNKWITPKISKTEGYIHEAVEYLLDNGMSFRLERIPLCYMQGFEEFSTEARQNVLDEARLTYFVDKKESLNIKQKCSYMKTEACSACSLNSICPGINPNYASVHGTKEIAPVFANPKNIVSKIIKSKIKKMSQFEKKVYKDLEIFKKAIENKPNKNNIYDTYTYFLMENIGLKEGTFVHKAWVDLTEKIKKGNEPNLLSLYIHFPYCKLSCSYCIYPSNALKDKKQIDDYLNYLNSEMKKYSPLFNGLKFKTLSIGGGTPSLMSEEQLKRLLGDVYSFFEFEKDGEKSVEFNPDSCNYEKLKILDDAGFNKLSIGVQSLSEDVLKHNNRGYQKKEKVFQAIRDFKKTGMACLNIDLVIGLNGDTPKKFLKTFEEICKMQPSLISVYPIKSDKSYIKKNYGNPKKFTDFYYPLFGYVTKELPKIAAKYRFVASYNDASKLSYVHPFDFHPKKNEGGKVKYHYSNFKKEPYSNLGIGFYAESCINNKMRYICVDKNNPSTLFLKNFSSNPQDYRYNVSLFLNNYTKVKFIANSASEGLEIPKAKYKEMFGKGVEEDFPYAISALKELGVIDIAEDKILFNVKSEKSLYPYLLFFAGQDIVLNRLRKA